MSDPEVQEVCYSTVSFRKRVHPTGKNEVTDSTADSTKPGDKRGITDKPRIDCNELASALVNLKSANQDQPQTGCTQPIYAVSTKTKGRVQHQVSDGTWPTSVNELKKKFRVTIKNKAPKTNNDAQHQAGTAASRSEQPYSIIELKDRTKAENPAPSSQQPYSIVRLKKIKETDSIRTRSPVAPEPLYEEIPD
nr:PREDICTED: uncharacterized protein LOC107077210 isoform X2 [Lepisosteus oculatus]